MPALFAHLVDPVLSDHHMRIREHQRSRREINAMLGKVCSTLLRVPSEHHLSIRVYIHFTRRSSQQPLLYAGMAGVSGTRSEVAPISSALISSLLLTESQPSL